MGGLRFDPSKAAFVNLRSKYIDEVLDEDLERQLNSENQFLDVGQSGDLFSKEGSKEFTGGLQNPRESLELKTDSRMLNERLGFDDATYSSIQANNSSQIPAYNHSVLSNKTRDSVVMLNLDQGAAREKDPSKKSDRENGTRAPDIGRRLSDMSSVVSKKSDPEKSNMYRQDSIVSKSSRPKDLNSKQSMQSKNNSGDRWRLDQNSGEKMTGSRAHLSGKETPRNQ